MIMGNNCKIKGCNNEAVNGGKYCNRHQAKKEGRNRAIGKGVMTVVAVVATVVYKKLLNDSDKS